MALVQGSVTVDNAGAVTSSGMAKRFYDADVATLPLATVPTPGAVTPPYSVARPCTAEDVTAFQAANIKALQQAARRANAAAAAMFQILTLDAHVVVDGVSLGKTPDPNDPNTAIAPPDAPVELSIQ